MEAKPPNRLINSTSPYLLQHAHNPVDWYEWGPEALARARDEDRPILLSIGYAACHWCHVMERESFENPSTAALMNESFVCVKVDREERPDLDSIYMDAVQAMTGQGGWPMTVFLSPGGEPFYAGTYFPPEDRHGLPGFPRLLQAIAGMWTDRRGELLTQGARVAREIGRTAGMRPSSEPLTEALLTGAVSALEQAFDREWGGFGQAPKFPQPMTLDFLLRGHLRGVPGALPMLEVTLDRMAAGGMYDQLGGGFHRYSTDRRWLVPHFEKMLYDNAQLALLYLRAWQVTGTGRYLRVCRETLDHLLREMRDPGGAFWAAQDADSEGVEGRFFVWSRAEFEAAAGEGGERLAAALGVSESGNWEGVNVLWRPEPFDAAAEADLDRARPALLAARARRVRPATDDKVLAAWNGLAIAAFAEAGRVLESAEYVAAAEEAARFVLQAMRPEGRLARAWRGGRTSGAGYADDHALMAQGCLALYETTYDTAWFDAAMQLARDLVGLFSDPDRGGFFTTGSDSEQLISRPKDLFDNALPSANSAAADVLQRLALITADADLERAGVAALRLAQPVMARAPGAAGTALSALDLHLGPVREVAIAGRPDAAASLLGVVRGAFRPRVVTACGEPGSAPQIPLLQQRDLVDGAPAAYVCERFACRLPVTDPGALAAELGDPRNSA